MSARPLGRERACTCGHRTLTSTVAAVALGGYALAAGNSWAGVVDGPWSVRPLAQEHVVVYESPDPARVYCYTPGILRLPDGRLIATLDVGGPGVSAMEPRGRIFISDDGGQRWQPRGSFPFIHARPFCTGGRVYILGHEGDLKVVASADRGWTWSAPSLLTTNEQWHGTAANVWTNGQFVYLVMEQRVHHRVRGWPVSELAPVLWRGRADADLLRRENWTRANSLSFQEALAKLQPADPGEGVGIPWFAAPYPSGSMPAWRRPCAPMGWLEGNVVQILDPNHVWHDPSGRTYHIWLRAHTGGSGFAAILKVVEHPDGSMVSELEQAPSGRKVLWVPCPGGHMRFHVLWDAPSRLYWLLSSQSTDSVCRPDRLPVDRFSLPNNERHRLQLHFSRNMMDWCFAGLIATGATPREARHYAAMDVDGDDLVILSRSGDSRARSAHDGNLITFHRVRNFRSLVY